MAQNQLYPELEALQKACPLPNGWELGEPLFDTGEVPGLCVKLVGLLARAEDGREALGSAGARDSLPVSRAYFELFERIAVLEALARPAVRYSACRDDGSSESLGFADVFPAAPPDAPFQYSRSNGVAAGRSWFEACASAHAELVERDRFLRAWYGELEPVRCALPNDPAFVALQDWYEFEAYSFPSRVRAVTALEVAAVFGFPKRAEAPLVFGSAASATPSLALAAALRECLQRWGFLWGERIPSEAPGFMPTADYHQEFYLWPATHRPLRSFLAGAHRGLAVLRSSPEGAPAGCRFVDLSPATGARVARAIPGAELPLTFGRGHPFAHPVLPESLCVHPIA